MKVMIDIETMGLPPAPAICSIGAVTDCGKEFHALIDWKNGGGVTTPSTIEFWEGQPEEARHEIFCEEGRVSEVEACEMLIKFFKGFPKHTQVWANSPSFDCQSIKSMFERCGKELPWNFWQENDFRTIRNLMPRYERPPVAHTALGDAISQMDQLKVMLSRIYVQG